MTRGLLSGTVPTNKCAMQGMNFLIDFEVLRIQNGIRSDPEHFKLGGSGSRSRSYFDINYRTIKAILQALRSVETLNSLMIITYTLPLEIFDCVVDPDPEPEPQGSATFW